MILLETLYNNLRSDFARQAVMNGNFDIWQRGTSGTISDSVALPLADRWYDWHVKDGGTLPTLTRSRLTCDGGLDKSFYYSRLTTDGAGTSLGVNSRAGYFHRIEHGTRFLCGDGKTVTLSLYARSSIANKKLGLWLRQQYGTGGSPTSAEDLAGGYVTLTSSWVRYEWTFTTNTLSGKTFGTNNDDSLDIWLQYVWGDTYGDSKGLTGAETYVGSGTIDIAQVQLNAGSVALPFYPKTFDQELLACQRFYEKSFIYTQPPVNNSGSTRGMCMYGTQATWAYHMLPTVYYKVKKRNPSVVPTIYSYNSATAGRVTDFNNGANVYTPYIISNGDTGFSVYLGVSVAAGAWLCFHWVCDCDLA